MALITKKSPQTFIVKLQLRAISTYKDHFKAILTGVDKTFPLHMWARLLPQALSMLNMLCPTNIMQKISADAYMYGQHNNNKMPLVPMGCAVAVHNKPETRQTWDDHVIDRYCIKTSREHYQCYKIWVKNTRSYGLQIQYSLNTSTSQFQHMQGGCNSGSIDTTSKSPMG